MAVGRGREPASSASRACVILNLRVINLSPTLGAELTVKIAVTPILF